MVPSNLSATTLLRMSLATMTRNSKIIVRAKCVGNSVRWDRGEIWTFTSFALEETWKGFVTPQFNVRLLGGRMSNVTSSVSGIPRFAPGEAVVLFLEPTTAGDYSVVAWEEGTFRIRRDPGSGELNVTEDSAVFSTFNPETRRFEVSGIAHESLARFRTQITAYVGASPENGR
jgi:hypothetical protein